MDISSVFRVLGDGLSILSLALIYSSTRQAWKRIPADVKIPMQWSAGRKPVWRASKAVGLLLVPVIATAVIFAPTALLIPYRADDPMQIVLIFTVRAVMASAFCIANLQFLKAAFTTLAEEGVIEKLV